MTIKQFETWTITGELPEPSRRNNAEWEAADKMNAPPQPPAPNEEVLANLISILHHWNMAPIMDAAQCMEMMLEVLYRANMLPGQPFPQPPTQDPNNE